MLFHHPPRLRSRPSSRRNRRGFLALAILCLMPATLLEAQGQSSGASPETGGAATIGLQYYHESEGLPGFSSVGGVKVEVRQLLRRGGMFTIASDTVAHGDGLLFGRNYVELRDVPIGNSRTTVTLGTLYTTLDAFDIHFSNLISPNFYILGGQFQIAYSKFTITAAGGRNQLFLGPGVLYLKAAPDSAAAFQLFYRPIKPLKLQFRSIFTRANAPLGYLGIPEEQVAFRLPHSASSFFLTSQYDFRKGYSWLSEVAFTHATPQPGFDFPGLKKNQFSFYTGPYFERDRFRLMANYSRQSVNYFPLSNQFLGDRQGTFVSGDYRLTQRVSVFGSFANARGNIERNPFRPTFEGRNANVGASFRLPGQFSLSANGTRGQITSSGAGFERSEDVFHNYSVQLQKAWRSWIPIYRFQLEDFGSRVAESANKSIIRSHELDVTKSFRNASSLTGGLRVQQRSAGLQHGTTFFGRLGGSISIRNRLSIYGQGEIGRDLANETLFAINNLKTASVGFQVKMPFGYAVRGNLTYNSLRTNPNLQNVFYASTLGGASVTPLYSLARWVFTLEITKSFRWGRGVIPGMGIPDALLSQYIPTYGAVDGYAFNDRNGNGERDAGEEGLPYVTVALGSHTVQTDATGRFEFREVRTGFQQVQVPLDLVPANYSPPPQRDWSIEVQQRGNSPIGIPVQVLGGIRGRVEVVNNGSPRVGFAEARLVLRPSAQATLTDEEGNFAFDNLLPGAYTVEIDPQWLPEGSELVTAGVYTVRVGSGDVTNVVPFVFQVKPVERPIQRVPLTGETRITLPANGNHNHTQPASSAPVGSTTPGQGAETQAPPGRQMNRR